MKTIKLNKFVLNVLSLFCFLITVADVSADEGKVRLTNSAMKQVIVENEKGDKEFRYEEPGLVVPGDIILYSITFENIGTEPATDVVINDPLPNNSNYRADSAQGDNTEITFSIDGGKTFGKPEELVVKDEQGRSVVAKPEAYTHIRWLYTKPLAPGEKHSVSFKTMIRKTE